MNNMKEQTPHNLLFYEIMQYPIPLNKEFFSTSSEKNIPEEIKKDFSWEKEDALMREYRAEIIHHKKLFSSLPFIKDIYLCNSITFNALHPESDIDLFIITKKNALRRARLCSALFFFFLGLKRTRISKRKKYCLTFYVTEDNQNLYTISLPTTDIYLAYRIAHLVPLYHEGIPKTSIYTHNQRIQAILPHRGEKQQIFLDIPIITGNTGIKKRLEKFRGGIG